jgi:hypothetical protein
MEKKSIGRVGSCTGSLRRRHLRVAAFIGSTNVLEFEHHREVSPVSGEVMLSRRGNATSVCPITGQHSLARNSDTRTAIDPPYGFTSPCGERYGLTLFR